MASPTMSSNASWGAVWSFGVASFSALDSDVMPVTAASTLEDSVVPAVAEGAVADSFAVDDNYSPPPSLLTTAIGSPVCCQAPGDSGMGSTGISSAPGLVFSCSSVWTSGAGSSVRFALHQIGSSVAKKAKERQ